MQPASAILSDYNRIRLVRAETDTTSVWVPNRYEFNAKGKWPWLQRQLFKILDRLRAYSYDTQVTYSTVEVDTSKIVEALMQHQSDVHMLMERRAKYLVIGVDAFAELSNDPMIRNYMRFDFQTKIGYNNRYQMLGLECIVVPWIQGFFILPDLEAR